MSGKSFVHSTAPDAFVQFWSFNLERLVDKKTNSFVSADSSSLMKVSQILVRKDIISISTKKTKGSVGTFSITLSSAANWKKLITVGSWCFIHISDRQLSGGEGAEPYGGLKMIGIVKSVRRQEFISPEIGTRTVRYIISGEDFQSMMSAKVYICPALTEGENKTAITSMAVLGRLFTKTFNGGPDEIVNTLIDAIIGNAEWEFTSKDKDGKLKTTRTATSEFKAGVEIEVPTEVYSKIYGESGTKLAKLISRQVYSPLVGKLTSALPSFSDQIELWSAIKAYSNPILNEVYTDLLPINVKNKTVLAPCFVMRPIPFSMNPPAAAGNKVIKFIASAEDIKKVDPKKMGRDKAEKEREKSTKIKSNLGVHFYVSRQIFEDEIISFDDGKSDSERLNLFVISSTIAGGNDTTIQVGQAGGIRSMVNTASAKRHGLRPIIYTSNFDTLKQGDTTFAIMTDIVKDMYQNGYMYENGFLTIVGTPNHIPVGTNIMFPERGPKGWIAHVEGVSYDFNVEPMTGHKKYLTNIAFTRLMQTNGDPIDEFGSESNDDGQLGEWDRGVVDSGDIGSTLTNGKLRSLPDKG